MTDPEFADATYIEPLDRDTVAAIIAREKPDALLPTVGGQTALNLAVALDEAGVLAAHGVETLGAPVRAVKLGEDRLLFKQAMQEVGVGVLKSGLAKSLDEARALARPFGYPVVIRPSFTLGGPVAASRSTSTTSRRSSSAASPSRRFTRSSSRSRSSGGRNLSSR